MQDLKYIAYAYRQLKIHEKNYPTHDLELEVVMFALIICSHYFYGIYVGVYTDHKIIQYVVTEIIEYPTIMMVIFLEGLCY